MADSLTGELIACHECDKLYRYERIPAGSKATCHGCGSLLYRHIPNSLRPKSGTLSHCAVAIYYCQYLSFPVAGAWWESC